MYGREELSELLDVAVKNNTVVRMIVRLMSELDQIPVAVETDGNGELSSATLAQYISDNELFTENPNYLEDQRDFMLFDCKGNMLLQVSSDETISEQGKYNISFSARDEDKNVFLDFCERLQRYKAIKYPE